MLGDLWWGGRVMFEKVFDDGDYFERFFRGNAARACASRPGRRRSRRHPAVADVLEQLYELPGAGSRPTGCRPQQILPQGLGIESSGPHNVRIPTSPDEQQDYGN